MPLLEGHLAVITGAGSGIGRAIALGFAREGARVVALDVNVEGAAETARDVGRDKGFSFPLDVADRAACAELAAKVAKDIGKVSVLVNNAGIVRRNPFAGDAEVFTKDWEDIMAVNLTGVMNVTQAFLQPLIETKGRIVNIGSIQSFVHVRTPGSAAYTTSKHGVLGFTRALGAELGKHGVRVNAIGPGFIATPLNANARTNHPDLVQVFRDHTPLGRLGTPDDIVGPALFLASDLSAYVTGSMVMADGGYRTI